jgi:protein-S-isoprenylcysteine O-methyltransferase Ste14
MINISFLTFFDISFIIAMLVISYLSKRLGDALKVAPVYKLLYVTSAFVAIASIIDIVSVSYNVTTMPLVSMALRFIAGAVSLIVALRYWSWLFSEFLRKQ